MRHAKQFEPRANNLLRTQGMSADSRDVRTDGWIVWGSIILVFLLSLLPWRSSIWAPDLLMLVIVFWAVHEGSRVGLVTGFVLGLLLDVHDAGPLGQHALVYVLACYGAVVLRRRMLRFNLGRQAIHMLTVFLVATALPMVLAAVLMGVWPESLWLVGVLLAAVLWVPVGWILLLPGNRLAAMNSQTD
jgi:rod shape-determining protein MreD